MKGQRHIIVIILLLVSHFVVAQENGIAANFVKDAVELKTHRPIIFNSVKIKNTSNQPITLFPKLLLPKGWSLTSFMSLPEKVTIDPSEEYFLPIKLAIPKNAEGNKTYLVIMQFDDNKENEILSVSSTVFIPEHREWDVEILEDELFIPLNDNELSFNMRVSNKGNTKENIVVEYQVKDILNSATVPVSPGEDTIITVSTSYEDDVQKQGVRRDYVSVSASNNQESKVKSVYLFKANNNYDDVKARQIPNRITFFTDFIPDRNYFTTGLRMHGSLFFKNNATFTYFMNKNDLASSQSFANANVFRFQYNTEKVDVSLGSSFDYGYQLHRVNTIVGRDFSNNGFNSLDITARPVMTDRHQTTIFAARNLNSSITSVLASHKLTFDNKWVEGGLAYTVDLMGKKSYRIGAFRTFIPLKNRHFINASVAGVSEVHHLLSRGNQSVNMQFGGSTDRLTDNGLTYRLGYNGNWTKGINVFFNTSYVSPNYPNNEQGLTFTEARIMMRQPKSPQRLVLSYQNRSKAPYTYQNMQLMPVFGYGINYYSVSYEREIGKYARLDGGVLVTDYQLNRPMLVSNEMMDYHTNSFRVFINTLTNIKNHTILLTAIQGFSIVHDYYDINGELMSGMPSILSQDLRAEWYNKDARIRLNYLRGPNSIVGQFSTNTDILNEARFRASAYVQKFIWNKKVRLSTSLSGLHYLDRNFGSVSFDPRLDLYTSKGFELNFTALLNVGYYNVNESWTTRNFSRFRIGVSQNFYVDARDERYNLTVVCFKDDNGNGKYDFGEQGLPNAHVKLDPILKNEKVSGRNRYVSAALFSDENGKMYFKNVAKLQYNLTVNEIYNNKDGYVYAGTGSTKVDVRRNMKAYIPFKESRKIQGKLVYEKAKFSNLDPSMANIRITVTDSKENTYNVLTDANGEFKILVADSKYYTVEVNNPFGKKVKIEPAVQEVRFIDEKAAPILFKIKEKSREVIFD